MASGANDPASKADVDAIIQAIIDNGNFGWTDDSGDGIQEPLPDVSDPVFAPARVPGGNDTTPPAITLVSSSPGSTQATVTWTTDEWSDSGVRYGTSAASLTLTASDPTMTQSHSVPLSARWR